MTASLAGRAPARRVAPLLAWGAGYLAAYVIGLAFADPVRRVAAIWPASGVALAALLSMPRARWPLTVAVFGGIALSMNLTVHGNLPMSLGFVVANSLEVLLGAWVTRRICRDRDIDFGRVDEVLALSAVAILVNGVTALVGAASPWLFGGAPYWSAYRMWWSANLLGIVVGTPFVLAWKRSPRPAVSPARQLEALAFGAAWATAAWVATRSSAAWGSLAPRPYTLFCLLPWAALRLGPRTLTASMVVLAVAVITAVNAGTLPPDLTGASFAATIVTAQLYVALATVTGLLLSSTTSETRLARDAAARIAKHLQVALDAARMGTWEWDVAKDGIHWSARAESIFGVAPGSFSGSYQQYLDRIHPDDRDLVAKAIQGALEENVDDYAVEHRIFRDDGTIRWLACRGRVDRDPKGNPIRMAGTVVDVTEQQQVADRLREAQKMETVGQLAGGVAHDFNNILSAIIVPADLARRSEGLPKSARGLLDEVVTAAQIGAAHTKQLLAFARRQVVQRRPVDLNVVVADLATMLGRLLGERVELRVAVGEGPLVVHADTSMVAQVLVNLAVNARDAMPEGGALTITTAETELSAEEDGARPGRYVVLRVADTGGGISPEHLGRIFEPFFTTKPAGAGSGLGLATVFGIARLHEGAVRVTSTVGSGTSFEVLLPRSDEPVAKSSPPPPSPVGADATDVTKATILLVEDNRSLRRTTRTLLEMSGYEVIEAKSGAEALRAWDEHASRIDLLFTDMTMPERPDGRELAAELRRRRPELRVLLTSGYSPHVAGRELDERELFLAKPSTVDEMLATVQRALDG